MTIASSTFGVHEDEFSYSLAQVADKPLPPRAPRIGSTTKEELEALPEGTAEEFSAWAGAYNPDMYSLESIRKAHPPGEYKIFRDPMDKPGAPPLIWYAPHPHSDDPTPMS